MNLNYSKSTLLGHPYISYQRKVHSTSFSSKVEELTRNYVCEGLGISQDKVQYLTPDYFNGYEFINFPNKVQLCNKIDKSIIFEVGVLTGSRSDGNMCLSWVEFWRD